MAKIDMESKDGKLIFRDNETGFPVFAGDDISLSYTLVSDDITIGERSSEVTPYDSRKIMFSRIEKTRDGFRLSDDSDKNSLSVSASGDVLTFTAITKADDMSEFGINFPFNFMGKRNAGTYKNQYLFNSPYRSFDETYKYCFLKNVNGNHLFVLFSSPADGWKMDYSPYVGGHYFVNLKCLANFDKVYGTDSKRKRLEIKMFIVKSLREGLSKAAKLLQVPVLYYDKSYSFDGSGELEIFGDCTRIEMKTASGKISEIVPDGNKAFYDGADGKTVFTPFCGSRMGLDCSVFAYGDLFSLYERSCDVIALRDGLPNLGNACECQCWASAMIRFMLFKGEKKIYSDKLKEFFEIFLATDETKAVKRLTVFDKPYGKYPAWHIFDSERIQEQAFAITILTDAYKLYGERKYFDYATKTLNCFIDRYQKEDGRLETPHGGKPEDYSTVCCLIIPIVDMALLMKGKDDGLYRKYSESATKLAEYVYRRGFSFPTEGGDSPLAEEQMEDGSISCSALTLLYYCAKINLIPEYLRLAKEILDFHENWVMETPDANVFRSSLRWWETRWEGDGDGPALCCGHAWSVWRAEADYWYYVLTKDEEYLKKAWSTFTACFAKFDRCGRAKSIYNMDYIAGGGFGDKKSVKYRMAPRFPDREDVKTARYVFIRAAETVLRDIENKC